MRIDLKTAQILTSPEARETLALFSNSAEDPRAIQESFRGLFPKKTAEALGELAALRRRATQKFCRGAEMFFTQEQLEQASSERVAAYRAERFRRAGCTEVWDPCCGIGADAIAMALLGIRVHATDKDPSAVHFAAANAEACGARGIDFRVADCTADPPGPGALFLDPARRKGSRRLMSPDEWSPPPSAIALLIAGRAAACLKLSPTVPLDVLLQKLPPAAEIETISLNGEAKETVFWYGACASGAARRATLLPSGHTFAGPMDSQAPVGPLAAYLFDPDPALVHSGLLGPFAQEHDLRTLDPGVAYLTGRRKVRSPFLDGFRVVACESLDPRRMRGLLRELGVGKLAEVRRRGVSERPASLEQRFLPRAFGNRVLTLIATRVGERSLGILAEPLA